MYMYIYICIYALRMSQTRFSPVLQTNIFFYKNNRSGNRKIIETYYKHITPQSGKGQRKATYPPPGAQNNMGPMWHNLVKS